MLSCEIPKMGNQARMSTHHSYFTQWWKFQTVNSARKRKKYKKYSDQKEIKLFIFADDMTVYAENLYIESTKTRIRKFRKAAS